MLRMRNAPRALAGGWLAALALSLAACGSSSSGLLSGQQAASLKAALDQVHASLRSHDCAAAESQAAALKARVEQLPDSVNPRVRDSLARGADTVKRLVVQDCTAAPATTPTPTQTTPPPTTPTTTTTTPTPTTPATTPSTTGTTTGPTTPTAPTKPGPPPGHGPPGKGHGNGHGKGGHDYMPPTRP
jgi:hypothetical protein